MDWENENSFLTLRENGCRICTGVCTVTRAQRGRYYRVPLTERGSDLEVGLGSSLKAYFSGQGESETVMEIWSMSVNISSCIIYYRHMLIITQGG